MRPRSRRSSAAATCVIDSEGPPEVIVIATRFRGGESPPKRSARWPGRAKKFAWSPCRAPTLSTPRRCIQAKRAAAVGYPARGGRGRRDRGVVEIRRPAGRESSASITSARLRRERMCSRPTGLLPSTLSRQIEKVLAK